MTVVSGFFQHEDTLRDAFHDLLTSGIPRDLIEVVIKKEDESRFFVLARKRYPATPIPSIGRGALAGLIVFAFISAALIVASRAQYSERLIWIMILGPNMGVIIGGLVGFIYGLLHKYQTPNLYRRINEGEGILLIAKAKSENEAQTILSKLENSGAKSVRQDYL